MYYDVLSCTMMYYSCPRTTIYYYNACVKTYYDNLNLLLTKIPASMLVGQTTPFKIGARFCKMDPI